MGAARVAGPSRAGRHVRTRPHRPPGEVLILQVPGQGPGADCRTPPCRALPVPSGGRRLRSRRPRDVRPAPTMTPWQRSRRTPRPGRLPRFLDDVLARYELAVRGLGRAVRRARDRRQPGRGHRRRPAGTAEAFGRCRLRRGDRPARRQRGGRGTNGRASRCSPTSDDALRARARHAFRAPPPGGVRRVPRCPPQSRCSAPISGSRWTRPTTSPTYGGCSTTAPRPLPALQQLIEAADRMAEGGGGPRMIPVTRLDGTPMIVNTDQIAWVEYIPDTVISLMNGEKLIVRETPEIIVERIREFRRAILRGAPTRQLGPPRASWRSWTHPRQERSGEEAPPRPDVGDRRAAGPGLHPDRPGRLKAAAALAAAGRRRRSSCSAGRSGRCWSVAPWPTSSGRGAACPPSSTTRTCQLDEVIGTITRLATKARRDGIMSLEDEVDGISRPVHAARAHAGRGRHEPQHAAGHARSRELQP